MIKRLVVGPMMTNCYILYFQNKDCFIIDPGDNGQKILHYIIENSLNPLAILITHGHFDHIGAIDYLTDKLHVSVYTHQYTQELLTDENLNLSAAFGKPFKVVSDIHYIENDLDIDGYHFEFMLLEGHCSGSCMIHYNENHLLFSGDVLFKGSIGRDDFPTSSHRATKCSLKEIKSFDFDATLLPGHGECSTLSYEQSHNPYLIES